VILAGRKMRSIAATHVRRNVHSACPSRRALRSGTARVARARTTSRLHGRQLTKSIQGYSMRLNRRYHFAPVTRPPTWSPRKVSANARPWRMTMRPNHGAVRSTRTANPQGDTTARQRAAPTRRQEMARNTATGNRMKPKPANPLVSTAPAVAA
jgi:hypothetical protein